MSNARIAALASAALVVLLGGCSYDKTTYRSTPDLPATVQATIREALESCDMLLTTGGVSVGERYAAVHFGKAGGSTTITGKGKMLTIPLPSAMNAQGVAKGGATDRAIFGETFVRFT